MADPNEAAPAPTAEAEKPQAAAAAPNPMFMLIGVAVAGIALGGALGGMVIAPRMIAARHATPARDQAAAEEAPEEEHGKEGGHGKGKHGEEKKYAVYRIDNVIVNPQGSQGSRFLMASIAFETRDARVEARLRERDAQVRDVVTATLESQTMEMLSRPGARDSLRHQLANVVRPLAGGAKLNVYLPQFVVQ